LQLDAIWEPAVDDSKYPHNLNQPQWSLMTSSINFPVTEFNK